MRLLRKKTEVQLGEALHRAVDVADCLLKMVADRDREIERLQAELSIQQAFLELPSISITVH